MVELKPCPFCGKSVAKAATLAECELLDTDHDMHSLLSLYFTVACNFNAGGCGASVGQNHISKEKAIEAWNRRVNDG